MAKLGQSTVSLIAIDANGDAVSGAKLYVYEAGTTTPVTTYSDAALTSANSSPVVANSAGKFNSVYVADGNYKVDIQDADGASLPGYPEDNINIPDNATAFKAEFKTVTALLNDSTKLGYSGAIYVVAAGDIIEAGGFRYEVAASGASDEHVATAGGVKLYVTGPLKVDPKAYGAVGDGTTDDSPAVQKALNEGGSLEFSDGTYRLATQLKLPVYTFYDDNPGHSITGKNAQIIVDTPANTPLFTADTSSNASAYTSKWKFAHLSYLATGADKELFDLDRIYNSVFTLNVFEGFSSVFRSKADRSGSPTYPDGYIQSAYIHNNHFAQNTKCVDAKRAFNLTVASNFFEANTNCVSIEGTADPAINELRILDNVMEGGDGHPISTGAIFGGVISGNYFEINTGTATCDIKLNTGSNFHRGLAITANTFQPSASQKSDGTYYSIRMGNTITAGRGPVVTGNSTSGQNLITGLPATNGFVAGNYEAIGSAILDAYPSQSLVYSVSNGINTGLVNNRATAYSAGTWQVFTVDLERDGVVEVDGVLNLYNSGGTPLGKTALSMKFAVYKDAIGVWRGVTIGTPSVIDLSGDRNGSGDTYYTGYWGTPTASYSFSGDTVTVSLDAFTDYSTPGPGLVYSLGPNIAVRFLQGTTNFSRSAVGTP